MKFSEDLNTAQYRITGYDKDWVRVNDIQLQNSFLLGPDTLIEEWPPQTIRDLTSKNLRALLAIEAEVFILGSGLTQQYPPKEALQSLIQHGIGFEVMTTAAACRTYNILLSESRRVAAAFLLG